GRGGPAALEGRLDEHADVFVDVRPGLDTSAPEEEVVLRPYDRGVIRIVEVVVLSLQPSHHSHVRIRDLGDGVGRGEAQGQNRQMDTPTGKRHRRSSSYKGGKGSARRAEGMKPTAGMERFSGQDLFVLA